MKVLAKLLNITLLLIVFLSTASAEIIKPLVKPIESAGYVSKRAAIQKKSDISVIRTGNIQFDASLLEGNVYLSDTYSSKPATNNSAPSLFSIKAFKDKVFTIELAEKTQHTGQSVSFQGRTIDSDLLNVVIVMTEKSFNITIDEPNSANEYRITGLRSSSEGRVDEVDMSKLQAQCSLDESNIRSFSTQISDATRQKQSSMQSASLREAKLEPTKRVRVDVLLVIDTEAQEWIRSDQNGDFEAFTLSAQTRMNNVTANSKLNIGFKVVGHMKVDSNTNGGFSQKLNELVGFGRSRSTLSQEVSDERDRVGADLVAYLAKANTRGGELGIAMVANNVKGHERFGYSVNAVNGALGTTLIHELGHNFGAGHSRQQKKMGYGGPNEAFSPDAGGMYLEIPHKSRYGNGYERSFSGYNTIMAYNFYGSGGNTRFYEGLDQFSSPNLTFKGKLIGSLDDKVAPHKTADSRKVLLMTSPNIAKYRKCKIECGPIDTNKYTVTVKKPTNGTLSCSPLSGSANTNVSCTAKPKDGYELDNWTDKCRNETGLVCQFTLKKDEKVGVTFKKKSTTDPKYFDLDMPKTIPNGKLSCKPSSKLTKNTTVTCQAIPNSGYKVAEWLAACKSTSANKTECKFTATPDNKSVSVRFTKKSAGSFNVTVKKPINGNLSCSPMSGSANTNVSCDASPNSGYELNSWTDKCRGKKGLNCQFTLTKDETVGVTFKKKSTTEPKYFDLDIPRVPNGIVSCWPNMYLEKNERVTCYAYPRRGYEIDTWLGACKSTSSNERKCSFNATFDNRLVSARFKLKDTAPSKKQLFKDGFE